MAALAARRQKNRDPSPDSFDRLCRFGCTGGKTNPDSKLRQFFSDGSAPRATFYRLVLTPPALEVRAETTFLLRKP